MGKDGAAWSVEAFELGRRTVIRAAGLFPNLRGERRGVDDAPPADPEPDTDVGAPLDCPSDLAVLQPNGSTYRPAANYSEAAELLEAAGWIDCGMPWHRGGTGLVVAVPHVITYESPAVEKVTVIYLSYYIYIKI